MKRRDSSFGKAFLSKKRFALVEIAIVLCSMFLVALPAIATEQNTQKASASTITIASEDDFTLEIYGNANEDGTIDMRDTTYIKLAIFGKKPETKLADANYDGKISMLDVGQTKLIILGKEKELTLEDSADRIVTVKKPVKRVVELTSRSLEVMRSLNVEKDIVVGIKTMGAKQKVFFPEFCELPDVGQLSPFTIDFEKILELDPDIVILYARAIQAAGDMTQNKLKDLNPNIVVLRFDCHEPETHIEEAQKMGYIFDRREEADEFCAFYSGVMNPIKERVKSIPEDERTRVYYEHTHPYQVSWGGGGHYNRRFEMAGAKLIFSEISPDAAAYVDPEEVVERNPELILKLGRGGYDTDDLTLLSSRRDEIMNRSELAEVTAIKEKRVYVVASITSGHFVHVAYCAKWFYPELFEDLDPQAIHQEWLDRFQKLDFDLDEKGVFAYPKEPV